MAPQLENRQIARVQEALERHSVAHHMGWRSTAQHSTAQHSTAQHSTAQHSTAQHSTAQHGTAQHAMHSISSDTPHACLPLTFVWLILNLSADGVRASEDGQGAWQGGGHKG